MTTMTAPARRSASAVYAAALTGDAESSRSPAGLDAGRLQRRRDRRVVAAAEASWLLALR